MFITDFANTEHTKERFKDYIVKRLLCRDVVVGGNPKVYKALKNQLALGLSCEKRHSSLSCT